MRMVICSQISLTSLQQAEELLYRPMNVVRVSDVGQTAVHKDEPLMAQ
jgi:acetolactate synthase small subunit